jgi:outer membrane protein
VFKVRKKWLAAVLLSGTVMSGTPALAETLMGALAKAYQNNGSLNSSRAGLRVTDENVAIAKSGYRPTINGTGEFARSRSGQTNANSTVGSVGIELNQMLFDGFQTKNNVASAETNVLAQQYNLRNTEQNTLFDAAKAYMDLYLSRQVAALRERNLAALNEQVRSARAKLDVGEGTRTDVAQAEAARASAVADLNQARADVKSMEATYRQIVGADPGSLKPAPLASKLPRSINQSYQVADAGHPAILATKYAVDAAGYNVKANEGALLPTLGLNASASHAETFAGEEGFGDGNSASVGVRVTVPIYSGGRTSALVRQSKEQLGQARIEVDVTRDSVRQAVASAWSQFEGARASVSAQREAVKAAQLALQGVIEERNVGQRTTLDVLNQQNEVVTSQIALAQAEHDMVLASYAILQSVGRLTAGQLGLKVAEYKPEEHYEAVKNKWIGIRTPDGR